MRKFTAILGLSIISAFFSPLPAQALTSDCYTYTTSGSTATITGTSTCTGAITVPSTLGGKTVVAIGVYAFGSESAVTSITLPDTVTTINTYSFYQMPVLTYLNLGNGVATLGTYNVYGCPQLTTLILGTGFRTLDTYAFTGNSSLTTINLPDGTTSINTYAFGNNAAVTTVTIPASVVNVETYAFLISNLTNITYAGYSAPVISQLVSTFGNCGWTGPTACTTGPAFELSATSGLASTRSAFSGYSISTTRGTGTVYSIYPAISNGLTFSTSTGLISGTPIADAGPVTYTITGTNSSGYATATYSISVDSTHQYIDCRFAPFFSSTELHVQANDSLIFSDCDSYESSVTEINNDVVSNVADVEIRDGRTFTISISNSVSPGTFLNAFTLTSMGELTQFTVVVSAPPAPVPFFNSLTKPKMNLKDGKYVCTSGTYEFGYTIGGEIDWGTSGLVTPSNYTYYLLINGVKDSALTVTTADATNSWNLTKPSSGSLISCRVEVTVNSLSIGALSTENTDGLADAQSAQSKGIKAAEATYKAAAKAIPLNFQKRLVSIRAIWREQTDAARANFYLTLERITANNGSKMVSDANTAAEILNRTKLQIAEQYGVGKRFAYDEREKATKAAIDAKTLAITKAKATYGTYIESIGYGVLIP